MKQATYDVANIGHFGLASKAYLHFTSPIRRYPDLIVHRVVHQVLTEGEPRRDDATRQKLADAALASSIAERRAMEVERAVVDLYRTFLMKGRIGERFHGTVTAVVGSGLFVQLDSPFVDVLIRLEDLGHDHWEVDDDALRVVAARSGDVMALGDRVFVEIIDAAILRRTVYAKRVGGEAGDGASAPRHPDGRGGREGRPGDGKARPRGDGRKPGAPARPGLHSRAPMPDRKKPSHGGAKGKSASKAGGGKSSGGPKGGGGKSSGGAKSSGGRKSSGKGKAGRRR